MLGLPQVALTLGRTREKLDREARRLDSSPSDLPELGRGVHAIDFFDAGPVEGKIQGRADPDLEDDSGCERYELGVFRPIDLVPHDEVGEPREHVAHVEAHNLPHIIGSGSLLTGCGTCTLP